MNFTNKSNNYRIPRFIFCRDFDDERIINYGWPKFKWLVNRMRVMVIPC